MSCDLFKELLPSIMQNNDDVLEDEKDYNPFVVNQALSHHLDCVLYANEVNINYNLDKRMQYDYLRYSIRKYKRKYQQWVKRKNEEDLELVKAYFNYSTEKARNALNILSKSQIDEIRKVMDKGGLSKK